MADTLNLENTQDTDSSDGSADELRAELETARAQLKALSKNQVDALINGAIKDTRLDGKLRSFAEEIANEKGVEGLKRYLSTLNPRSPKPITQNYITAPVETVETVSGEEEKEYQLSDSQKIMAERLGISEKKFRKNMSRLSITVADPKTIKATFVLPSKKKVSQ